MTVGIVIISLAAVCFILSGTLIIINYKFERRPDAVGRTFAFQMEVKHKKDVSTWRSTRHGHIVPDMFFKHVSSRCLTVSLSCIRKKFPRIAYVRENHTVIWNIFLALCHMGDYAVRRRYIDTYINITQAAVAHWAAVVFLYYDYISSSSVNTLAIFRYKS